MRGDLEILRELVKDTACVFADEGSGDKTTFTLKEPGSGGSGYNFEICGVPTETIAINVDDNFPAPAEIFKCGRGECKRADFVLITITPNKKLIIYIELKKGTPKRKEVVQQLKGARCFMAYCRAVGREFWGQASFLQNREYEERFVGVVNIGLNKRPVRPPEPSKSTHDKPENFRKFNGRSRLYFADLINSIS